MKMFLISDTHFNHTNIIKYCDRPFHSAHEMNEALIYNWNSVVSENDIIYHLGDFGLGNDEQVKAITSRLNGKKILILGNHDVRRGIERWKSLGFYEVYKKEFRVGKYILTHRPIEISKDYINIFGHIHNKEPHESFNSNNHINVSVEVTNYYPIEFDEKLGIIDVNYDNKMNV